MVDTPARGVYWDVSLSESASSSPTLSIDSASSMDYINSQLMAHGFVTAPGIVLGDMTNAESERIVKCFLGMLSQRVEDMSRTEELSTKLRTLTYDHERLRSLHRASTEKAANAEREMNVHKSRLNAATRTLQASEASHKQIASELQRTRTMLQGVRATHQAELKKKEKEIERVFEKWSKIADAQVKLMTVPSGIRCANVAAMSGSERMGNRTSFLELALEEAEKARNQLSEDNLFVRKLVVTAVNEVQSALHQVRPETSENAVEPIPFTLTSLFPLHPAGSAGDKVNIILNNLKDTLTALSHQPAIATPTPHVETSLSEGEIQRLQGVIAALQDEIERLRKQAVTQAAETRAMFDKFAEDHRIATSNIGEISMELISAPLRDMEKERLDEIKRGLNQERQKFTEAAIEMGKERAEIQAERVRLMDEKRSWQVQAMLADLPPTPPQPSTCASPQAVAVLRSPKKSPRKAPAKVRVGKAGSSAPRKTIRLSRRSSLLSPSKVLLPYETEVLPPLPALNFNSKPLPLASSLLPTSFVLPPPSPHASLPAQPAIMASVSSQASPLQSTTSLSPTPSPLDSPPENTVPAIPSTPPAARLPFPVAKPFAQRMIHAYSPAKPSPLSRILMLGNSPNSPGSSGGGSGDVSSLHIPVTEEDKHVPGFEDFPIFPPVQMSLAAELGLPESPSDRPLQDKKLEPNVLGRPLITTTISKSQATTNSDPKRHTAQEKGKAKAVRGAHVPVGRVKTSAAVEKENSRRKNDEKVFKAPVKILQPEPIADKKILKPLPKSSGVSTSRKRLMAKLQPPTGGPRRVLVDSDEAPPVAMGRKS